MKNFCLYRYIVFIPVVLMLLIHSAYAKDLDGIAMPDSMSVGGKELVLNGMGTRKATIFSVKVYVMGLYLEQRSGNADTVIGSDGTKMIVMKFVRDVGADKLIKGWQEGFEKSYPEISAIKKEIEEFKGSMSDIKKGQSINLAFIKNGVEVRYDDVKRTSIEGKRFQQALLSVWLGPEPPNPDLKKGILGE